MKENKNVMKEKIIRYSCSPFQEPFLPTPLLNEKSWESGRIPGPSGDTLGEETRNSKEKASVNKYGDIYIG
jgi:hypothetical protein